MDYQWLKMARPVAALKRGRTDWYRIENKTATSADVYIYDEIGYWGVTSKDFAREVGALDVQQINLHLNSPGGEVGDGLAIYEVLRQHQATVTAYVDGYALSAASFILQAADTRIAGRNSMTMIHNASGLAIGTAQDMRQLADVLDKLTANVADIYAQRAGGSVDFWLGQMDAETWYTAQEAVDAGLADQVGEQDTELDNHWDLSIFNHVPAGIAAHAGRALAARPTQQAAPPTQTPEPAPWPGPDPDALREALKEAFR